jgi:hypothetical protein
MAAVAQFGRLAAAFSHELRFRIGGALMGVALKRFSPLKPTIRVPSPGLGYSLSPLRLKFLKEDQASIKVPSTVK